MKEIQACRICGNHELTSILDLGIQALTGKFPASRSESVATMPLELVKCLETEGRDTCGLVQLQHTGDLSDMYGEGYGYRSGLNQSMVQHLKSKVKRILDRVPLADSDLVIDIGSNDSTLLQNYPSQGVTLVGVDPSGANFKSFYPSHIRLIPDFFSLKKVESVLGKKKAKIITSISMFYDLEEPMSFMREVYDVLDNDGLWVLEQSYMPTMLEMNSYDTVCHEHLEYYGLKQIKWMADRIGFHIVDIEFNGINGGSFSLALAKKTSKAPYLRENSNLVAQVLEKEKALGLHTLAPYEAFKKRVFEHREKLLSFLRNSQNAGKTVFGYGASTKGNVVLQFCGITEKQMPMIAEVNPDKFNHFTPGTTIPIVSEKDAKALKPDYFMVLPWHFKDNIVGREGDYLKSGGKLLFPLPSIEVVQT